jgi:hypothetical protein
MKKWAKIGAIALTVFLGAVILLFLSIDSALVVVETDQSFPGGVVSTERGHPLRLGRGKQTKIMVLKEQAEDGFVLKCDNAPLSPQYFGYLSGGPPTIYSIKISNCSPSIDEHELF